MFDCSSAVIIRGYPLTGVTCHLKGLLLLLLLLLLQMTRDSWSGISNLYYLLLSYQTNQNLSFKKTKWTFLKNNYKNCWRRRVKRVKRWRMAALLQEELGSGGAAPGPVRGHEAPDQRRQWSPSPGRSRLYKPGVLPPCVHETLGLTANKIVSRMLENPFEEKLPPLAFMKYYWRELKWSKGSLERSESIRAAVLTHSRPSQLQSSNAARLQLDQWSSTRGPPPLGGPWRYCRGVIQLKKR